VDMVNSFSDGDPLGGTHDMSRPVGLEIQKIRRKRWGALAALWVVFGTET
jgi:hypothetical protein